MIHDLRTTPELAIAADAVVVIGSGPAGLALVTRLLAQMDARTSTANRPVVLLESGGDLGALAPDVAASQRLNECINSGEQLIRSVAGRSRNLGGAAQTWHGQCMRLHEIDLRVRGWVPHSGWPLELADLEDAYRAAERWLQVKGLVYGAERWREHPGLPPVHWTAEHLLHDFTEYAPRPQLGAEHRRELALSRRVQVIVNATVTRLVVAEAEADGTTRIAGVEVATPEGRRCEIAAATVVLSAGAIENPRLLQLSDPAGIGLGTGRVHTGRFLQDHANVRMAEVVAVNYRYLQDRYVALHQGARQLFPKVRLAPAAQEKYHLLDATAVFQHEHAQPALDAARRILLAARARQRPLRPVPDILTALRAPIPVGRDAYRRYVRGLGGGSRPSGVFLQVWLEQVPNPELGVSLSPVTDSLGCRRAEIRWGTDDLELETSRQLTRWIADDLSRLGRAEVRPLPPMYDDDAWREQVIDAFHPSGTTRMATDAALGVVDVDLQVHGVRGLFVLGSSVFPTAGYANPTLTIVALAIRLADHLGLAPPA